ncbi:MAG: RNA-directed DNA polymerase, partial [Erysipelotrichaceae bacterium]|nr:RNA-directed DNA polymerase [Erysipelotrichaceae bacterium]
MIIYRELASLVRDLGFSAHTLYALSNTADRHFHRVTLDKGNGEARILAVPDRLLKTVQKRINEVLLPLEEVSQYAMAYRPGTGTVFNAAPHLGTTQILKLDIRKFFDHITYPLIKNAFPESRYSEANRVLLAMMCSYRDGLPQGAPSSPAISNIIMKDFDDTVGSWCHEKGIVYTRYCDDMTFSGRFNDREVEAFVAQELRKMGFFLNARTKTAAHQGQRMLVTGINVD